MSIDRANTGQGRRRLPSPGSLRVLLASLMVTATLFGGTASALGGRSASSADLARSGETADSSPRAGSQDRIRDNTRLTLKIDHVRHGYWKFNGTLFRQGHRFAFKRVQVQVALLGSWQTLNLKLTDRRGVAHFDARPDPGAGRYRLRLYYAGSSRTFPAMSRTFRLYP